MSPAITQYTQPFPAWVIDDFLPDDLAPAADAHFFDGDGPWIERHHLYSRHKATRTQGLHPAVEAALRYLESPILCATMERLTGLRPLHADPDRFGGGQHVTRVHGRLGVHADFTHHPRTGARRALNLLLYLNRQPGAGGALELWSPDMRRREVVIAPVFNRAVIFATSATSYHGHPEPLRWARERRSLAVYYYSNDCCLKTDTGWDTSYLRTTDYRPRPQDWALRLRRRLRRLVKGR